MESNWAAEHLQVIRTLMERSAIYRRALGPIMVFLGCLGIIAAAAGSAWMGQMDGRRFILYWTGVAAVAMGGAFFLGRRQALKDAEAVWSPPTRRVIAALMPSFVVGIVLSGVFYYLSLAATPALFLPPLWMMLYGCSLHSAGFFMPRGIRWFGWGFVVIGSVSLAVVSMMAAGNEIRALGTVFAKGHVTMGLSFGLLHLAYGVYLYFTEKRRNET